MALALIGDNSLLDELRIMISVELFLNIYFYYHHHLNYVFSKYKDKHVFNSVNNFLHMSASFESSENFSCPEEIVKGHAHIHVATHNVESTLLLLPHPPTSDNVDRGSPIFDEHFTSI